MQPKPRRGCLQYAFYLAAWVFLYAGTLEVAGTITVRQFLGQESVEGYGAYLALVGYMVIMPAALLVSCVVFAVWKRAWIALMLAVIVAAATALAPPIVDAFR